MPTSYPSHAPNASNFPIKHFHYILAMSLAYAKHILSTLFKSYSKYLKTQLPHSFSSILILFLFRLLN